MPKKYNGGPGRVGRAIKKYDDGITSTLVEKNAFPVETDNYVPKIIAAAVVGKYFSQYVFINLMKPLEYDTVEIGPDYSIARNAADMTEESFQNTIPSIHAGSTGNPRKTCRYDVPDGKHFTTSKKDS